VPDFDIASICAHPDDAELTMGGTLALEARRGRRVAIVDLTRGESGSRGTPETREREAAEAARILGAAHRESLGLPDSRLTAVPEQRDVVVEALRRLRPRVVLLPHWEQRHPDHTAASRLVYDACFVAGLRAYRPELGGAFRPAKLVYSTSVTEAEEVKPSFIVDITPVWETKLKAIAAFASQFTAVPGESVALPFDGFRHAAELSARRAGQRIGVEFGEGFVTREALRVDDLLSLSGRSL
jgi:bacillithiol biosynthesis deacetylase BshB1